MIYRDYHLHTGLSFDSREQMENVCEAAVDQGIEEIAFTEHVEFAAEDVAEWPDFKAREEKLRYCREKYGSRLIIRSGVESGQPYKDPIAEKSLFQQNQFDFVIGSVHMVADTGRPSKYAFDENNYLNYFKLYFRESMELAQNCEYDVMGHVTFPFRYVPQYLLEKYPIQSFRKEYQELFEIIIRRDKGIEINTSGLRTPLKETMPSIQIVRWFRDCGGKIVTVGSDGHSARNAFSGIEEGYQVLKEAGYREVAVFQNRQVALMKL